MKLSGGSILSKKWKKKDIGFFLTSFNPRKLYKGNFAGKNSHFLFDIEKFNYLNDTQKNFAGDIALEFLSRTCLEVIRRSDIIARRYGDEFLIMFYRTDHKGAIRLAERIQKRVRKTGQRKYLGLTLSMGISETGKSDTKTPTLDDVLARADKALYSVKGKGRNRVETEL